MLSYVRGAWLGALWLLTAGSLAFFQVTKRLHLANQCHATAVMQKSLREGFDLTVTEALWKARPVIASRIGGIQDQIEHGVEELDQLQLPLSISFQSTGPR